MLLFLQFLLDHSILFARETKHYIELPYSKARVCTVECMNNYNLYLHYNVLSDSSAALSGAQVISFMHNTEVSMVPESLFHKIQSLMYNAYT